MAALHDHSCEENDCSSDYKGVDRISQLSDDIIVYILSFLPLKEVVATSILSPRWSSLWKYTFNLIFVNSCFHDSMINIPVAMPLGEPVNPSLVRSLKNAEWVNSVLNSYKAPSLKEFTISFYVHPNTFYQVSKWLHFAFSRRVESLKLGFKNTPFVLDINILSGIQISDYKFLRELTLNGLCVTGEAIEFLQRNCSVLERLIMNATLTSDLVVGGTLKYLEIIPYGNCGKFIRVSAPNLTRLSCSYDLERLLLENVPNLVEASFSLFGLGPINTMHLFANAAAKLEILTITLRLPPTVFQFPQMPKLKKLVLDYNILVTREFLLPVACLLEASPCLEEFKLQISDLFKYDYHGSSNLKAIFEVPKLGGFPHYHLNVFEFSGFFDKAADHVELVRYIANNCAALEEIIITTTISAFVVFKFLQKSSLESDYVIALEQKVLEMKKSTEQLLVGKVPDHIKLLIN